MGGGKIPLEDESVDRVFLLAVLEHLDMDSELFDEGARLINKNGLYIVTTPTTIAKPVLEFLSYRLGLISRESIEEHKHYYSKKELFDRIKRSGLEVLNYQVFEFGFNQLIVGIRR